MATNISFENQFERPVTSQQIQISQSFFKVFNVDGFIKKKEEYLNNELVNLIYYLDVSESESQAISLIMSAYSLRDGFEIRQRENYGIYKKETCRMYSASGVYDNYTITLLYDAQGRPVYEKDESILNGVLQTRVRKFFYDTQNLVYDLIYDNAGILIGMEGKEPPFVPENDYFIAVGEFPLFFPNFLAANPYYANANP